MPREPKKYVEDPVIVRDENGRVQKGSQLGALSRGSPKTTDPTKQLRKEAKALAQEMLSEAMPDLLSVLEQKAKQGELGALQLALKHGLPTPRQESFLEGCEEAAMLDAPSRVAWAGRAAMEGQISLEQAEAISKQATYEAEAQVLRVIQGISRDLKNGLAADVAVRRLFDLTQDVAEKHTPTLIEHDEGAHE